MKRSEFDVVFVWNRTLDRMRGVVPDKLILEDLAKCRER